MSRVVTSTGIATNSGKIAVIREWSVARAVKDIRAFLGTVGCYQQYIKDFDTDAQPLHRLTAKYIEWKCEEDENTAVERMKCSLTTVAILGYPNPNSTHILNTDVSDVGVGAVLCQIQDKSIIEYFRTTLALPEKNYCATRKELLAIIKAVKNFSRKLCLWTDHGSFRWLCLRKEPSSQVAQWLKILVEFTYFLEHTVGNIHGNADGLSCRNCKDC